jgi:hypothetical protein
MKPNCAACSEKFEEPGVYAASLLAIQRIGIIADLSTISRGSGMNAVLPAFWLNRGNAADSIRVTKAALPGQIFWQRFTRIL